MRQEKTVVIFASAFTCALTYAGHESHLEEINRQLKDKLRVETNSLRAIQESWQCNAMPETDPFFNPHTNTTESQPTLQIGYHQYHPAEANNQENIAVENNDMLGWSL